MNGEPDQTPMAAQASPVPASTARRVAIPTWAQFLVLVALWAILFVVGLGDRGLAYSEGHRVGPAWEMLRAGLPWQAPDAWLAPRLFEQPYFRKPPGMPWAIALSSALLGHTETAARLPSSLAMLALMLVSWRLASRWFGTPWGLAAGITQALTPFFWSSARSAEIEMLHTASAGIASLLLIDALTREPLPRDQRGAPDVAGHESVDAGPAGALRRRPGSFPCALWLAAATAGIALAVMVLTKGPAAIPVVFAALVTPCLLSRSFWPLRRPALLLAALIPAALLTLTALAVSSALERTGRPAITQGAGEFLWDLRELDDILMLPFVAIFSMLPGSLALVLIPWRHAADPRGRIARTLGLALLLSIALFTALGVSNPRYTLPAATLAPPLAAWALSRFASRAGVRSDAADGRRTRLFRLLSLGHLASWPILLSGAFILFLLYYEAPRGRTSGDSAGAALAAILEPAAAEGSTVWVDQLVECRPEVLLYARKFTPLLDIRWVKPLESAPVRPGDILITRTDRHDTPDGEPTERDRVAELLRTATRLHDFAVHKYRFEVHRLGP